MLLDEALHQSDGARVVHHVHRHAMLSQEGLGAWDVFDSPATTRGMPNWTIAPAHGARDPEAAAFFAKETDEPQQRVAAADLSGNTPLAQSRNKELTMSVLAILRWRGDPDSLIAAVDKELEHPVARHRPRRQLHVRARADDGLVIVDLWDSREDFDAMVNDPEFLKNRQGSGTPEPDSLEVFEVHATVP